MKIRVGIAFEKKKKNRINEKKTTKQKAEMHPQSLSKKAKLNAAPDAWLMPDVNKASHKLSVAAWERG